MMMELPEHDLLDAVCFVSQFSAPLGQLETPVTLAPLMRPGGVTGFQSSDELRKAVRDMLRLDGFKPTGRSKPASEYLLKATVDQPLRSINLAVDACNIASLHSGLPISVFDLERAQAPLKIAVADQGTQYVFNPSGQTMDIGGLLCVFDQQGPCANAVKDSQRTKTCERTTQTMTVIWGTRERPGYAGEVALWYQNLIGTAAIFRPVCD